MRLSVSLFNIHLFSSLFVLYVASVTTFLLFILSIVVAHLLHYASDAIIPITFEESPLHKLQRGFTYARSKLLSLVPSRFNWAQPETATESLADSKDTQSNHLRKKLAKKKKLSPESPDMSSVASSSSSSGIATRVRTKRRTGSSSQSSSRQVSPSSSPKLSHRDPTRPTKTTIQKEFPTPPIHLILDLDETLVRSSSAGSKQYDHMLEVVIENHVCLYYIYKRPYVDHFLKKVSLVTMCSHCPFNHPSCS
jgi:hypothetical protein